ncbi:MAG: hypothetical protein ICV75_06475 [Nitrospiraceae bacterium]|nr:hypothetical protein [Nitrospiraceae bacterium]
MFKTLFWLVVGCSVPDMTVVIDQPTQPRIPGFNERLNQALGSEGGVQVYQDGAGNVGTIIDPPGGERRFSVQPPPSPSMNLGPPLQLSPPPVLAPPTTTPAPPSAQDFPQKAR